MNKVDQLTSILEKLNSGEITQDVKNEALKLVSNISPLELSMAEQKLIEKGMKPEDLRNLCEIHMEVLEGELEKTKAQVNQGHMLYTLFAEHDSILGFLKDLESVNHKIQDMKELKEDTIEFVTLRNLADKLLETEKHHQREEEVLFIEMEKRGVTGPTRIMKMEHDDMRQRKQKIKELAYNMEGLDFKEFKTQLDEAAKYIVFHLRDHIFKENYILYPSALETIKENAIWDQMKEACNEIGYCSFTLHH